MSDADAVIAALRTGHDGAAALVSTLSDDDLARPSAASDWDVSQVVSHLGSGAEIARAGLQAALDGAPNPGGAFNQSVWDRWNAMTRRERADAFVPASEAATELYESLDATTRAELKVDLGFLPAPVDVAIAGRMRLNELTLHAWDVRVVFEPGATLPDDAAAALLHGEPNMLGWVSKPAALAGRTAVLAVTTSRPSSIFTLRLSDPVSTELVALQQPDGTLTLPAEAWLRLVSGRLAPEHTPADVAVTGVADLDLLRAVFPGY